MIVTGKKYIVIQFPRGTARFNEGNTVPESLIPYVSPADKKYLKDPAKGRSKSKADEAESKSEEAEDEPETES